MTTYYTLVTYLFTIKTLLHNNVKAYNPSIEKTWSNRLGVTLTPIKTGVWAAERPFIWQGIDVGGRSVICRMNDATLLVHSPVEYTEDLGKCIDTLGGEVGHIISPNFEHLKYAKQWAEQFPNSIKYACPGLPSRLPDINWNVELNHSIPSSFANSIDISYFDCETNPFTGKPFFNEVVFYHIKSKSVFMADTFWNYPSSALPNYYGISETGCIDNCPKMPTNAIPSYSSTTTSSSSTYLPAINVPLGTKLWKYGMDNIYLPFYKRVMVGGKGRSLSKSRRLNYEKAVNKILNWDIETIIPCHGDIIRGKDLCNNVLRKHFLE